jgi:hypothetical protein
VSLTKGVPHAYPAWSTKYSGVYDSDDNHVADVSKDRLNLFLAAPDMLAALEDFIAAGTMDCCCGETPCCGSCTITMAKNAVKKARGE